MVSFLPRVRDIISTTSIGSVHDVCDLQWSCRSRDRKRAGWELQRDTAHTTTRFHITGSRYQLDIALYHHSTPVLRICITSYTGTLTSHRVKSVRLSHRPIFVRELPAHCQCSSNGAILDTLRAFFDRITEAGSDDWWVLWCKSMMSSAMDVFPSQQQFRSEYNGR